MPKYILVGKPQWMHYICDICGARDVNLPHVRAMIQILYDVEANHGVLAHEGCIKTTDVVTRIF